MMLAEGINKILSLVLIIIIARYLGDFKFGQYSFIITMMMLFQVLADFGLDGLTIREVAKNLDKTELYLGNALALKFILGLISFILLSITINLMDKPFVVIYGVYIGGLAIIFYSLANTFNSIFNAHERLELKASLLIVYRLTLLGLSILAIILNKNLVTLISAILISEIIRFTLSWVIYSGQFTPLKIKIDFSLCNKLLGMSLPFAVIGVIALIYFKIDIVMLSLMKGDQVVGWYSAAYNLLAALLFITESYNLAIFPLLSRTADTTKELLAFSWEKSVKYLLIISLPISVGTAILAGRFIRLFYSSEFNPSILALQILIWTLPWIFVNSINVRVLYATDKQRSLTLIVIISAVINIIFNFLLIPRFSYIGASLATLLAEIINVIMCFWLVFNLLGLKLNIRDLLSKPLLASAIMGFVIFYLRQLNLISLIIIGIILYPALLFVLRTFDKDDERIIQKLVPISIFKGKKF